MRASRRSSRGGARSYSRILALALLALALAACEGAPPASTATPATRETTPLSLRPVSLTPLPSATADQAVRTPAPAGSPLGSPARQTSGLVFISNGNLEFYDADHREPRFLVRDSGDITASEAVVEFALAPARDRVAYFVLQQHTVNGICRTGAAIRLIDLRDLNIQRQIATALIPPSCPSSVRANVVGDSLTFSSDGRRLAYLAAPDEAGPVSLWVADSDPRSTQAPVRLATPEAGLLIAPTWAPDDRQIALVEASDLGQNGTYDGDLAVVALAGGGTPGAPRVVATGHALPGNRQAQPPFDLTWLDTHTLAFQSWVGGRGPDGGWVVDTGVGGAPRLLSPGQAGLGGWSPELPGQPRVFAYRIPGVGLAAVGPQGAPGGSLLAALPSAGGTGPVSPLWSADGASVAFSTSDGALRIADRAAPGPPVQVPMQGVLRAAWTSTPSDEPLLAVAGVDGKTLGIFDRQGRQIARTRLNAQGSPRQIAWQPNQAGGLRRLVVGYASGAPGGTQFVLVTLDRQAGVLTTASGPPADDVSRLRWVTRGAQPAP